MNEITTGLIFAAWGFAWCWKLTTTGPFAPLAFWVAKRTVLDNPKKWTANLYNVLFACPTCHGAQVALWWSIFAGCSLWQIFAHVAVSITASMIVIHAKILDDAQ